MLPPASAASSVFGAVLLARMIPLSMAETSARLSRKPNTVSTSRGHSWDYSIDMPSQVQIDPSSAAPIDRSHSPGQNAELPMTVKDAARFLGVSAQTVYLWVERKQIPHLRVMGRNIRFLKSDLEPFRAQFKQEVENGTA